MDADTLSPQLRQERRSLAVLALGGFAAPGLFEVFAFVPEIEVVFFEAPRVLDRIIGDSVSREMLEEGRQAPKKTLDRVSGNGLPQDSIVPLLPRLAA